MRAFRPGQQECPATSVDHGKDGADIRCGPVNIGTQDGAAIRFTRAFRSDMRHRSLRAGSAGAQHLEKQVACIGTITHDQDIAGQCLFHRRQNAQDMRQRAATIRGLIQKACDGLPKMRCGRFYFQKHSMWGKPQAR